MNENTRFLISIYRERDIYSELKYKILNIVRDLYSERKYKII